MSRSFLTATFCISALIAGPSLAQHATTSAEYRAQGEAELAARVTTAERPDRVRNVIIFIGDGRGVSTLTAARILVAENAAVEGEAFVTAREQYSSCAHNGFERNG